MFKILRVIFAVGAAVLIALCVFAGILWDMIAVWACLGGALLFFALSMLFRFLQEEREKKEPQPDPSDGAAPSGNADEAAPEERDANADQNADDDGNNMRE